MTYWRIISALVLLLQKESISLSLIELDVPGYKVRGDSVLLQCRYDLEGDALYSVKWYKDGEEFYRYMPKMNPPQHSYRVEGVRVDETQSDDKEVMLKSLTLKSTGMYRCEVSAEAPSFASASAEDRMDVVYLPKNGPYISGGKESYHETDLLALNCTSGRSYPASMLQWYVDDEEIHDPSHLVRYSLITHRHGLLTSTLGLKLKLKAQHRRKGPLEARCTARLSPSVLSPARNSFSERVAPLIDKREAIFIVQNSSTSFRRLSSSFWLLLLVVQIALRKGSDLL